MEAVLIEAPGELEGKVPVPSPKAQVGNRVSLPGSKSGCSYGLRYRQHPLVLDAKSPAIGTSMPEKK